MPLLKFQPSYLDYYRLLWYATAYFIIFLLLTYLFQWHDLLHVTDYHWLMFIYRTTTLEVMCSIMKCVSRQTDSDVPWSLLSLLKRGDNKTPFTERHLYRNVTKSCLRFMKYTKEIIYCFIRIGLYYSPIWHQIRTTGEYLIFHAIFALNFMV